MKTEKTYNIPYFHVSGNETGDCLPVHINDFTGPSPKVRQALINYRTILLFLKGDWKQFKTTEERILELAKKTIDANTQSKRLRNKIFLSKKGYRSELSKVKVMDVVDASYAPDVYKSLIEFYEHDKEFVKHLEKIHSEIEKGTPVEKIKKKYGKKYYVVVGGNTRVALIIDEYYRNRSLMESDGSLKEEFEVAVIDYDYEEMLNNDNIRNQLKGSSRSTIEKVRWLYQIAFMALMFSDNEVRNNDMESELLSHGYLGKLMVERYADFIEIQGVEKIVKQGDHAAKKIEVFDKLYTACDIKPDKIIQGMLACEVRKIDNFIEINGKEVLDSDLLHNDHNSKTLNYYTRLIKDAVRNYSRDELCISRAIGEKIGVNINNMTITDENKTTDMLNWTCKQSEAQNVKKSASYAAKVIKDEFRGHRGFLKDPKNNLSDKEFKNILEKTKDDVEAFVNNEIKTVFDKLKDLLNEDSEPKISKLKIVQFIEEFEGE